MELVLLDSDFNIASSPIDDIRSLVWVENWHEYSTFKATLSNEHFTGVKNASYVYDREKNKQRAGIIETIESSSN